LIVIQSLEIQSHGIQSHGIQLKVFKLHHILCRRLSDLGFGQMGFRCWDSVAVIKLLGIQSLGIRSIVI
jgi:hypothetical protein